MHLIKCENEHIYDKDKFRSCPHCSKIRIEVRQPDTFGLGQKDIDTAMPAQEEQKSYQQMESRRVTGLLICVAGQMQGEGFLLREGDNDIGRSSNMDVALTKEITISRKKHATIHCEAEKGSYVLSVNKDKSDVYCNGNLVKEQCELALGDEIMIGDCHLKVITAPDIWKE